jgi:hypothetical protein
MKTPTKLRAWTATDVYKLKGLAKKNVEISKIARALNRSPDAALKKARELNIQLNTHQAPEEASAL